MQNQCSMTKQWLDALTMSLIFAAQLAVCGFHLPGIFFHTLLRIHTQTHNIERSQLLPYCWIKILILFDAKTFFALYLENIRTFKHTNTHSVWRWFARYDLAIFSSFLPRLRIDCILSCAAWKRDEKWSVFTTSDTSESSDCILAV